MNSAGVKARVSGQGRAPGGPPFFRGRAPKGKNPNIFGFFGIFMIFFVFDTLGLCLRVLGSYLGVNGTEHKDLKFFRFFRFHRVPPMLTVKCYFRGAPPEKGRALRGAPLTGNPASIVVSFIYLASQKNEDVTTTIRPSNRLT